MGVDPNLFIEVAHDDHVVSILSKFRHKCFEIMYQYLPWIGIDATFETEHIALLGIGRGVSRCARFLRDLVNRKNDESFSTASHEFNPAPSAIWVREGATDASDETIRCTGECAARFMIAFKNNFTCACNETSMIPDFSFVLL